MKKNILIWTVCAVSALGLSGCTDKLSDNDSKDNGTGWPNAGNGVTFYMPTPEQQKAAGAKTRLGGRDDEYGVAFVWTKDDDKYFWCDVNSMNVGGTAQWEHPFEMGNFNPLPGADGAYYSAAFAYNNLQRVSVTWDPYDWKYYPYTYSLESTNHWYGTKKPKEDGIMNYTYYERPWFKDATTLPYYTVLYTGSSSRESVTIPRIQHQTGDAGYADKLRENGACFVGYAYPERHYQNYEADPNWWQNTKHKDIYDKAVSDAWQDEEKDPVTGKITTKFKRYQIYIGNNESDSYYMGGYRWSQSTTDGGDTWSGFSQSSQKPSSHGVQYTSGHKASYLSFMVYNPAGAMANTYIKEITVQVGNQALWGENLPFSVKGIDLTHRPTAMINRTIKLMLTDGLSIAQNREKAREKAAIITALPGEYTNVNVSIKMQDPVAGKTFSINKSYPKMVLKEGGNRALYYKLDIKDFSPMFSVYCMWGAGDTYWNSANKLPMPHPWNISGNGIGTITTTSGWATDNSDVRWYGVNQELETGQLGYLEDTPSPNDISYILDQCYWDDQTEYSYDGHAFKGLLWIPIITTGNTSAKDGDDYNTSVPPSGIPTGTIHQGVHNVTGYFPLPAAGYWENGQLKDVGKVGRYWLKFGNPDENDKAYCFEFTKNSIKILYEVPKTIGCIMMPKQ